MKSPTYFPPPKPALKLVRRTQSPIATDAAGVDTRPIAYPRGSAAPMVEDDAALAHSWTKLHRAREILELEQRQLQTKRIVMEEWEASLQLREAAVAARERAALTE